MSENQTTREIAEHLAKTMRCNCDFDRWEPEYSTGHSFVCRIHKAAMAEYRNGCTGAKGTTGCPTGAHGQTGPEK